tara:strand:- start:2209 stop:3465 length:1257 start_codon:yes stop_codon:yes gene_type:complete
VSRSIFSEKALASLIRVGDSQKFGIDLKTDRTAIIAAASSAAMDGSVDLTKFSHVQIRGKPCVYYGDYQSTLLLRAISRHIRNRLRVAIPNRDRIVRGVVETLMDGTPMFATRRDITSFYETIPIADVRDRLIYDTASSAIVRTYLKSFFNTHCPGESDVGVPRGIGLSALLAELAMREFDQEIRDIDGVFKYYRFADDILVFSICPADEITDALAEKLPSPMAFNSQKSEEKFYPGKQKEQPPSLKLEYLGYEFDTVQLADKRDSRSVRVAISGRKINRIKSRLILSLKDYLTSKDWHLLRDRVGFLSSNFRVRRHGTEFVRHSPNVFSGIFFNYRMCGQYYYKSGRMFCMPYDCRELKALDGFYHSLIKTKLAGTVSATRLNELKRLSFNKGYELRIRVRFEPLRVNAIKQAWLNV